MKKLKKIPGGTWFFGILGIILLLWGGYKLPQKSGDEAVKSAVVIENGKFSADADGATVFVTGKPVINKAPVDPVTGIEADGYLLIREVEMYQYYLDGDAVYKDFSSSQIENIRGRNGEEYENAVFPENLTSAVILGEVGIEGTDLRIGEDYLYTLTDSYTYMSDPHDPVTLTGGQEIKGYKYRDGYYYSGSDRDYQLGEIRISYKYIPADSLGEITLVGTLNGDTVGGKENTEDAVMTDRIMTVDEMSSLVGKDNHGAAMLLLVLALINFAVAAVIFLVKRKKLKKNSAASLAIAIIVSALILAYPVNSKADFGDFGGDYDYGGYDYGGNDYGGYDYGGNDYDYDYDDDYDRTRTTTTAYYYYIDFPQSSGTINDGGYAVINSLGKSISVDRLEAVNTDIDDGSALFGTGYFGYIIGYIIYKLKKPKKRRPARPASRPAGAQRTNMSELLPIEDFKQIDTGFDEEKFKEELSERYVKFQRSWQNRDMSDLREYLTDEFYAQCEGNLDNYIRNDQRNIIENIIVHSVDIKGWKHDNTNDVIIAELKTEITDYVINDRTGEVIRGSKTDRRVMQYEWALVRKSGITTDNTPDEEKVCPNCGAPLTLNAANECEYCGSIITTEAHNWAVSSIKGISQRTIRN